MLVQHFRLNFEALMKDRAKDVLGADLAIRTKIALKEKKIASVKDYLGPQTQMKKP